MLLVVIVAPSTGAWIEIKMAYHHTVHVLVAPSTGAWIEISFYFYSSYLFSCRTLYGCVD